MREIKEIPLSDVVELVNCLGSLDRDVALERQRLRLWIGDVLDEQKARRGDVDDYAARLLLRQRVLNERAIAWSDCVHEGTRVLDACAGPEGSLIAVTRRGGLWTGNEISQVTARYLEESGANVIVSSAERFDCEDSQFDFLAFIFALNNVQGTLNAFIEADRVLDDEGKMLICDPGPCLWQADLFLYTLLKMGVLPKELEEKLFNTKRFREDIPDFYGGDRISISHVEYTERVLGGLLGTELDLVRNGVGGIEEFVRKHYPSGAKKFAERFRRVFSEVLQARYWQYMRGVAVETGFELERMGAVSTYICKDESGWSSTPVIDVDPSSNGGDVGSLLYLFRNGRHSDSRSITCPVRGVLQNVISHLMLFKRSCAS